MHVACYHSPGTYTLKMSPVDPKKILNIFRMSYRVAGSQNLVHNQYLCVVKQCAVGRAYQ